MEEKITAFYFKKNKTPNEKEDRDMAEFKRSARVELTFFPDDDESAERERLLKWVEELRVGAIVVYSVKDILLEPNSFRLHDILELARFFKKHKTNFVCLKEGFDLNSPIGWLNFVRFCKSLEKEEKGEKDPIAPIFKDRIGRVTEGPSFPPDCSMN